MTDDPIEQSDDLARIKTAYRIACMNLAELGGQRSRLVTALDGALVLVDRLLAEMRDKGVEPSPQIIAFKAGFDRGMRELLGRHEKDES
jgi:hypothetical protein